MSDEQPFDAKQFRAALSAVDQKKVSINALSELRALLNASPGAWRIAGDLGRLAWSDMMERINASPSVRESVKVGLDKLREALASDRTNAVEALAIDAILTAWLDMHLTTMRFSQNEGHGLTLSQAEHWQKRVTLTQGRYLRALETLARIRKLNITIQVNIAAAGGQQVNVAGELPTGRSVPELPG